MNSRIPAFAAILIALVALLALPSEAEARKRGLPLLIINTGEEISKVADLPAELQGAPDLQGWSLGYKYSHFGILWADVATWDKQLVAFKDDTYSDLPEDMKTVLEEQYPFSSTERNLWNRFGIFLIGGLVVLGFLKSGDD